MHGEEAAADEIGLYRLAQAQRHVGLAHREIEFVVRQQQLQLDLRVELDEFAQSRREPVGAEPERGRHPEFAVRLLAGVDQAAAHRVELEHDVVHRAEQHFALFGQDEAAGVAMEERRAEVGFERADLAADRGLAETQRLAGVGERAGVGGRLKDAQLVPVHDRLPRDKPDYRWPPRTRTARAPLPTPPLASPAPAARRASARPRARPCSRAPRR